MEAQGAARAERLFCRLIGRCWRPCGGSCARARRGAACGRPPGPGQRLDPAPRSRQLGPSQPAGEGARPAGRHAARPPDLILDSCSVRAKRGGDLTGPNPTDRGKRGTKYHIATTGDGVPVACAATAANVNDTLVFERLFLAAFAVMARIRTVFADKGYDAEPHRELCRPFGAEPCIHKRGQPRGSGWASGAGRSSAATPGCWRTSASPCATTGSASSSSPCSRPPASSWLQAASPANSENRLSGVRPGSRRATARSWPARRRC
jgi:hypothetical protein